MPYPEAVQLVEAVTDEIVLIESVSTDCAVSVLASAVMSLLTLATASAVAASEAAVATLCALVVAVGVTVAATEAVVAIAVPSSVLTATVFVCDSTTAVFVLSVDAVDDVVVVDAVSLLDVVVDELETWEVLLLPSPPPPHAARRNAAGMRVARVFRQKGAEIWFMTSVKIQSRGRLGMLAAVPPPEGGGAEKRARWRFALPAPFEGTFGWADALKCTDEFRSLGV